MNDKVHPTPSPYHRRGGPTASMKKPKTVAAEDYFESYEDLGVHHLMLRDRPRSEAYRKVPPPHCSPTLITCVVC